MSDRSPMSNYTPVCLRVCGREKRHECAFVYVPPIIFLMWRDLAKHATYRNWIWVKTREWLVTSLACSRGIALLWNCCGGLKNIRMLLGSTCVDVGYFWGFVDVPTFDIMYASNKPTQKNSKLYEHVCSLRLLPNLCQWAPTTLEVSVWLATVRSH